MTALLALLIGGAIGYSLKRFGRMPETRGWWDGFWQGYQYGVSSNHERTEAKCRLYRRMLPKIGEFFYLAPKGSAGAHLATAASS